MFTVDMLGNLPETQADFGVIELQGILQEAVEQVTSGKGNERHGGAQQLYDQPWYFIAQKCGIGFLTGQAVKKITEAASLNGVEGYTGHQFEREMLGAINYIAFAIMFQRAKDAEKNPD